MTIEGLIVEKIEEKGQWFIVTATDPRGIVPMPPYSFTLTQQQLDEIGEFGVGSELLIGFDVIRTLAAGTGTGDSAGGCVK